MLLQSRSTKYCLTSLYIGFALYPLLLDWTAICTMLNLLSWAIHVLKVRTL